MRAGRGPATADLDDLAGGASHLVGQKGVAAEDQSPAAGLGAQAGAGESAHTAALGRFGRE